ncbi:MAG: TetR/AcrR family transcriptional regulator [Candidatus Dormibacteraceae bacterium]
MARLIKEEEYNAKCNAILDVTRQLVETKGYEQMAIRDILDALQISKGAFYHYFDSKSALLFALVERKVDQVEELVLPIVHDPNLSALDKLLRYFATIDHWKLAHKRLMLAFLRVWYADENALVRHKLYIAGVKRFTPGLSQIIQQGVEEGAFTTPYPDQAARTILSLHNDLGYTIAELLLSEEREIPDFPRIAQMTEATADALERVVGVKPGCLRNAGRDAFSQWQASLT